MIELTRKLWEGSMQSKYLSTTELAEMIGCSTSSFACMRRHLQRHSVPFIPNLRGFPQVDRRYYDARMSGAVPAAQIEDATLEEPDFSAI